MGTTFGIIAGAISTAVSAVGTIASAEARADQAEFNQAMAAREARLREERAETQREAAQVRAERQRRRGDRRIGTARAAVGASGIQLGGTPTDVLADEAMRQELAVQDQLFESELQALQTERAAEQSRLESANAGQRASSIRTSGFFQAGTSLATGATQTARRAGAFQDNNNVPSSTAETGGVAGNIPNENL
jgi:hypothetical protein